MIALSGKHSALPVRWKACFHTGGFPPDKPPVEKGACQVEAPVTICVRCDVCSMKCVRCNVCSMKCGRCNVHAANACAMKRVIRPKSTITPRFEWN